MKYKLHDIPYCGCRADKIQSALPIIDENNFKMFVYWINERSKIHIKKDLYHMPSPWTEDVVLQKVRFTNVRRELDKQTRHLITRVCEAELPYETKIINIILFRMLNKIDSLDGILPIDYSNPEYVSKVSDWIESLPKDHKPFNNVFMVSGMMGSINAWIGKRPSQIQSCIDACASWYYYGIAHNIAKMTKANDIYEYLHNLTGIGSFLAYQMFVDMTYCPECPVSENEFVVAGPGCKEGIKLLFDNRNGMTPEECLFWLRNHWLELCKIHNCEFNPDELFPDIPQEDRYMNVMSLQNCCCEFSKFYRAYNGGFIKKYYKEAYNEQ